MSAKMIDAIQSILKLYQSIRHIKLGSHTINQSINLPNNQSNNQSVNQATNQSIGQSNNQSINQPTNQSIGQSNSQSTEPLTVLSPLNSLRVDCCRWFIDKKSRQAQTDVLQKINQIIIQSINPIFNQFVNYYSIIIDQTINQVINQSINHQDLRYLLSFIIQSIDH
jgi:hypothetical protein